MGETRNVIYGVDNECVIYVNTLKYGIRSNQGQWVDAVIPERVCEEATNGMYWRSAGIPIAEPVGNAEDNETLTAVCVVNVDNLMISREQTQ